MVGIMETDGYIQKNDRGDTSLDELLRAEGEKRLKRVKKLYSISKMLLTYQSERNKGRIDEQGSYKADINVGEALFGIEYKKPSDYLSFLSVDIIRKGFFGTKRHNVLSLHVYESGGIHIYNYKSGNWEKLLENEADGYIKSPVSPEARKQIARQKPTVQKIVDDEEASRQ
jgi:hypothetical protein